MPVNAVELEERLLEALASVNDIGAAINRFGQTEHADIHAVLGLIVESAIKVIPGAAAVIYSYDPSRASFDPSSRVSAGAWLDPIPGIEPRAGGMGARAIEQHRSILSYDGSGLGIHPKIADFGAKAAACFPLFVADHPLGALYVYLNEDRRFTQLEQLMLENFVNQAAMAIYQAQQFDSMQRDLARKDEELNHLRRAGMLISSRLRLEDTLEAILQMALEVTGARYGIFRLVDKSGQKLITRAIAGEGLPGPKVEALPIDSNSIMSWVARSRRPACIADLRLPPWSGMYYPLDAGLEMRAELAVPLVSAGGRLEGVLNLESPQVGAFSDQDSHLLQSFATQAVIAIQEVRLLDALQEAARLLLIQPCQQVLGWLSELACDLLGVDTSGIWTLEDGQLSLRATCGSRPASDLPGLRDSLPRRAIAKRELVESGLPEDMGKALMVPLLSSGDSEPLGAFGIFSAGSESGYFADTDWDKKVLTCLAQYAALAVLNDTHQEALQQAQEQRAVAETFAVVGDVAANLLHQLNNKVGTIPVRIQGIQDKCQTSLNGDRYLAANLIEIERSASEAMEAVRENLSHLRPIHLAEVGVASCVHAALDSAGLPEGVKVRLENLDSLPVVMAGQRNLTLVFTNLLENASDAMRGNGAVTIRGSTRGNWVEITVSDTGPGILPELHDRIFEFNFSGRRAARPGKLGFGLWWVRTLMARLGGSVVVESDGIHGAAFRLRLPVAGAKM